MSAITSAEYKTFLKEIKERIHKAQYDAFKAVNKELIQLYWDIGKSIVLKQETLGWGKSEVETFAKRFTKRVSRNTGVFCQKSLEYEDILSGLQRRSKTAAIGCRNQLDEKCHYHGALHATRILKTAIQTTGVMYNAPTKYTNTKQTT